MKKLSQNLSQKMILSDFRFSADLEFLITLTTVGRKIYEYVFIRHLNEFDVTQW